MRFSEEKITHLSHVIFDALARKGAIKAADDAKVRRELKQIITHQLKKEDEREDAVRNKIFSYSRKILEGSPEWDVLFQKHYQEELKKKGRA